MSEMNLRGQLHVSFESELAVDEKGLWSGSQIFHCHADDLAELAPKVKSAHPRYSWLFLESFSVSGLEGDIVRITGQYAGVSAEYEFGNEGGDDYESGLRLSTQESPLALNPYFDDLTAAEVNEAVAAGMNPARNADGTVKVLDQTGWSDLKKDLYDRVRKGNTHFKDSSIEYYIRYNDNTKPTDIEDIGKKDNPKGAPFIGAFDRSWLLNGYNVTERGRIYEIEKVWLLSGRGGWDDDLYSSQAAE